MLTIQTCTLAELESCMFENAELPGWENVYIEFIDLSGLAATDEYDLLVAINNITVRIETVPTYIEVQKQCIRHFNMYGQVPTEKLAKFGYPMPNDISKAEAFLNSVLSKEKRWRQDLRQANDKLEKLKHPEGSDAKKASRSWGKTKNEMSKRQGYRIDSKLTLVKEYALMILAAREEAAEAELAAQFNKVQP